MSKLSIFRPVHLCEGSGPMGEKARHVAATALARTREGNERWKYYSRNKTFSSEDDSHRDLSRRRFGSSIPHRTTPLRSPCGYPPVVRGGIGVDECALLSVRSVYHDFYDGTTAILMFIGNNLYIRTHSIASNHPRSGDLVRGSNVAALAEVD